MTRVIVDDCGADALLVPHAGGDVLVLRPGQTTGSAVRAVSSVLPSLRRDQVRHLVRTHMPGTLDFDELLPAAPRDDLRNDFQVTTASARRKLGTWVALGVSTALMVAGFVATHAAVVADPPAAPVSFVTGS